LKLVEKGENHKMTRRERREHIFKLLFLKEYHSEEEIYEQVQLYLEENYLNQEAVDEANYHGMVEDIAEVVHQITQKIPELDKKIDSVTTGWKTGRMSKVDLTLIRLALYEILYDESVPVKVAINEAVELSKVYGGDDSASFINGILGKLVK
jgi:N utilization substance protein B